MKAVGLSPTTVIQRPQTTVLDSWAKSSTLALAPRSTPRLPPLEALKLIMSLATVNRSNGIHIMLSHLKRAYLNALARRALYVELPREDPGDVWGQCAVGRLRLAFYGTRDAAQLWQECLAQHLVKIALVRGVSNPCIYHHSSRGIRVLVHGDDYASTGTLRELRWMKGQL